MLVDKTEYIQRLQKEMTDSGSYEEIPDDLTETATKTVRKLVNRMYKEGVINKDLQKYLIPKYPKKGIQNYTKTVRNLGQSLVTQIRRRSGWPKLQNTNLMTL